jgi:Family of unknown function (DUF6763)
MISAVSGPQIGQWYERVDPAETFQVTGIDDRARTIEIQSLNGDLGEIDRDTWSVLPLSYAEPPEDGIVPLDEPEGEELVAAQAEATLEDPTILARLA